MPSIREKMVVIAPTPRPSISVTVRKKPRAFRSRRTAERKSMIPKSMIHESTRASWDQDLLSLLRRVCLLCIKWIDIRSTLQALEIDRDAPGRRARCFHHPIVRIRGIAVDLALDAHALGFHARVALPLLRGAIE